MSKKSNKASKLTYHYKQTAKNQMIVQEMKFDFVYRGLTFRELSEKFNIPFARIEKEATDEHWHALRNLILENRNNAWFRDIEATYIANHKEINKQMFEIWQKIIKVTEQMIDQGYYETGNYNNPDKKALNPYTVSTLSCIIEKAQAGIMASNKMLTIQQEKLLEIQLKKIEQEEIQAPQGFSAKDLFVNNVNSVNNVNNITNAEDIIEIEEKDQENQSKAGDEDVKS